MIVQLKHRPVVIFQNQDILRQDHRAVRRQIVEEGVEELNNTLALFIAAAVTALTEFRQFLTRGPG